MFLILEKPRRLPSVSLEPRRGEDLREIVAPELDLKSFRPFEKQVPERGSNLELCDADAAMFNQMSYQTNCELVVYMCVDDKPMDDGF